MGRQVSTASGIGQPLNWLEAMSLAAIYGLIAAHICIWRGPPQAERSLEALSAVFLLCLAIQQTEIRIAGGPMMGRFGFMFMPMVMVMSATKTGNVPVRFVPFLAIGLVSCIPTIALMTCLRSHRRAKATRVPPLMHDATPTAREDQDVFNFKMPAKDRPPMNAREAIVGASILSLGVFMLQYASERRTPLQASEASIATIVTFLALYAIGRGLGWGVDFERCAIPSAMICGMSSHGKDAWPGPIFYVETVVFWIAFVPLWFRFLMIFQKNRPKPNPHPAVSHPMHDADNDGP